MYCQCEAFCIVRARGLTITSSWFLSCTPSHQCNQPCYIWCFLEAWGFQTHLLLPSLTILYVLSSRRTIVIHCTTPEFCWHSLTDFSHKVHGFLLCSCLTGVFPGAECFWDSAHSSWKFSWLSKLCVVFLYQRFLPHSSKLRGCKIFRPDSGSIQDQCSLASCKFYGLITANNQDVLKSPIHKTLWTHTEVHLKWFFLILRGLVIF